MSNASSRIQRPTTQETAHQKQKMRFNTTDQVWEVYTFLTGTIDGPWKWYKVTNEIADWYAHVHKIPAVPFTEENNHDPIA